MRVTALGEATSLADRKRRAGQRLLLRWSADRVTEDLRRVVREIGPAGFVVDHPNAIEAAQLRELTRELAGLADPHHPALILATSATLVPEAAAWPGHPVSWSDEPDAARALAREQRALGLDLLWGPPPAPTTPAFVRMLAEEHVCVVPGPVETPEGSPSTELARLLQAEPGALRVGPNLTLLQRGLRSDYEGVLVHDHADWPVRPVLGLQASIDLQLTGADHATQLRHFGQLVRLQEVDRGAERACQHSTARVHALRERLFLEVSPRPSLSEVGHADHLVFAKLLSQRYPTP